MKQNLHPPATPLEMLSLFLPAGLQEGTSSTSPVEWQGGEGSVSCHKDSVFN